MPNATLRAEVVTLGYRNVVDKVKLQCFYSVHTV